MHVPHEQLLKQVANRGENGEPAVYILSLSDQSVREAERNI